MCYKGRGGGGPHSRGPPAPQKPPQQQPQRALGGVGGGGGGCECMYVCVWVGEMCWLWEDDRVLMYVLIIVCVSVCK